MYLRSRAGELTSQVPNCIACVFTVPVAVHFRSLVGSRALHTNEHSHISFLPSFTTPPESTRVKAVRPFHALHAAYFYTCHEEVMECLLPTYETRNLSVCKHLLQPVLCRMHHRACTPGPPPSPKVAVSPRRRNERRNSQST